MGRTERRTKKGNDCYTTPEHILADVRRVFLGPIGLDPATSEDNPTRAITFFTPAEDGKSQPWAGLGPVFLNPPYGRELPKWVAKLREEMPAGIVLVPARPGSGWYRDLQELATGYVELRGRLRFGGSRLTAMFPSAVFCLARGSDRFYDRFKSVFGQQGQLLEVK